MSAFPQQENRQQANKAMQLKIGKTQDKTLESLQRTTRVLAAAQETAIVTNQELRHQGNQVVCGPTNIVTELILGSDCLVTSIKNIQGAIQGDIEGVDQKLKATEGLQNTFDLWHGNWFGGKKREAHREVWARTSPCDFDCF
jgi:hypothetical protein